MMEANTGMKTALYETNQPIAAGTTPSDSPQYTAAGGQYPPVQHVSATQSPYPATVQAQPYQQPAMYHNGGTMALTAPPRQRWRDGICDWGANLWPSCGCVCCLWGLGSAWLVSQMSQKTGYMNFYSIMRPFLFLYIIAWLIQIIFGTGIVYLIPAFMIYVIGILLRMHVAKVYQISENGDGGECLIGCFCWPCSVAQMARHVYGYTKVFDGDSDPERGDQYVPIRESDGQGGQLPVQQQPVAYSTGGPGGPSVTYVSHSGYASSGAGSVV